MPTFVIEETVPVWVTYQAAVEAPTREEAIEDFKSGAEETRTLFGDTVPGSRVTLTVDGVTVEETDT